MTTPGVVFDVGGTTLRAGLYRPGRGLARGSVHREPTPSRLTHPGLSVDALQALLCDRLRSLTDRWPEARWVSAAVAGPTSPSGVVHRAPSLWGDSRRSLDLQRRLARPGRPARVVNDVTAAAAHFAAQPAYRRYPRLGVLTVSTGLGLKVVDTRTGEAFLNGDGYGGEIGHLPWESTEAEDPCTCGRRGHVNAAGSGRGAERSARNAARRDVPGFRASSLYRRVSGDPSALTTALLMTAAAAGDDFAAAWLARTVAPVARILATLTLALGLEKFVVMGGLALAAGGVYTRELRRQIAAQGLYGRTPSAVRRLVEAAPPRDDYGLLGAGRLAERTISGG